ncbi:hypothetical protein IBE20_04525 [Francisella tularensis subsp. novicida]|nr:hypothetical protein [Francisella tularensis]AJI61399.1 hypothetical protein AW25_1659 [Francisella tularensis subsp. novicida U112]EDX19147.1 hypothetical protein FTE_1437 [Francisella tularensis subsp. novicida FTE]MBK2035060.1 hypothetical protein [Francisella tularensis subsp. novicida]MBK2116348.1 hypothetical protein [Francisella tularensis subsp. novicida]MBK2312188.1 hypothetical protein [Francisella tularensis subsp. novicida]
MLIKTIHLDNNFEATNPSDKDYLLSIDTVITDLDSEGVIGLFVEIDVIAKYVGLNVELVHNILNLEQEFINKVHYRKININGHCKQFLDIEYLNIFLLDLLNQATQKGYNVLKLQSLIVNLSFTIITEWNNQAYKLKKAIAVLDITIANTFDNSKDIFNLLSYFSNRVS